MKAYVIKIPGQEDAVLTLKNSIKNTNSDIDLSEFEGTVPETISCHLDTEFDCGHFETNSRLFKWTWPNSSTENGLDLKSGLYKFAYNAVDQNKKVACTISHMRLWDICVKINEPIIVLESDAIFTRKFESNIFGDRERLIVGLNDPRGATRRSQEYHNGLSPIDGLSPVPTVNRPGEPPMPQGIAGNSAYYITPKASIDLLQAIHLYGGWPNDAIMCKEIFPYLRQSFPYYTKVQGLRSTTTR